MGYRLILPEDARLGVPILLLVASVGIGARIIVQYGGTRYRGVPTLDPYQVACLVDGPLRMVLAAGASLQARGSIRVVPAPDGLVGYRRPGIETVAAPADGTRLEQAVYAALAAGTPAPSLTEDRGVRDEIDAIAGSLAQQGFSLTRRRRWLAHACGIVGGIAALLAGTVVGAVGFLFGVWAVPARSRLARGALAHYRTSGPVDQTMTAALFGPETLRNSDPALLEAFLGRTI